MSSCQRRILFISFVSFYVVEYTYQCLPMPVSHPALLHAMLLETVVFKDVECHCLPGLDPHILHLHITSYSSG